MPLRVVFYALDLPEDFIDRTTWEEELGCSRRVLADLLGEDPIQLVEEAGGMRRWIRHAYWRDAAPETETETDDAEGHDAGA